MISTQILLPIVERLRVLNQRAKPLLSEVGIDPAKLNDVNESVRLQQYISFFELAAVQTKNHHFGLEAGKFISYDSLGALGFLFVSAPRLKEALKGLTDYISALQEGTRLTLTIKEGEARHEYQVIDDTIAPRRQDTEYSLAACLTLMKKFSGPNFEPNEVSFEHERVGNHATYEQHFGCHVFFNQPTNYIAFDAKALMNGTPSMSDKLYPIITNHLQSLITSKPDIQSTTDEIAALITYEALEKGITVESVSADLGISKSTLMRRLKIEKQTFNKILTEKRISFAKRLLRHSQTPIAQIALKVGYSENASFTRAFRQNTGLTPDQYRRG